MMVLLPPNSCISVQCCHLPGKHGKVREFKNGRKSHGKRKSLEVMEYVFLHVVSYCS